MPLTMTLGSMVALFGAMLVLAAMPSTSVLLVISRSAASGFIHGAVTASGIVAGDILFILIAILGLSLLADSMGDMFVLVRYLGGAYLVWMGISLLHAKPGEIKAEKGGSASLSSSFLSGLLFTLADQKAILFYLGFLPAFIDLSSLSLADIAVMLSIVLVAVGGVKITYAFMANGVASLFTDRAKTALNITAGSLMLAIGLFVVVNA